MRLPLANAPDQFALVDDDYDGEWLSTLRWKLLNGHAVTQHYRGNNTMGYLSRMAYGESLILPGHVIRHKNGNPLDCRTANLISATWRDMALSRPQGKLRNNQTGYRGVSDQRLNGKQHIYAVLDGKYARHPDGYIMKFDTLAEAARVYDYFAYLKWGDKATLNFPNEPIMYPQFNSIMKGRTRYASTQTNATT